MLHVWGCGEFGQHGHGSSGNTSPGESTLKELEEEQVVVFGCGASHTLVFTESKKLFCWGNNSNGQLGLEDTTDGKNMHERPHLVGSFEEQIVGIACGCQHSYIWLENGNCIRFGKELNQDSIETEIILNGQIKACWITTEKKERQLLKGSIVRQVACGTRHAILIFEGGSVHACGANNRGQLGSGDKHESLSPQHVRNVPNIVKHVACGNFHSLCITEEGDIYNWGYGPACGSTEDVLYPALVERQDDDEMFVKLAGGDSHSLALSIHGNVFGWGSSKEGQFGENSDENIRRMPINLSKALQIGSCVDISSRDNTSAVVQKDGKMYMWGKNMWDVLAGGDSIHNSICKPFEIKIDCEKVWKVAVGSWHTVAVSYLDLKPRDISEIVPKANDLFTASCMEEHETRGRSMLKLKKSSLPSLQGTCVKKFSDRDALSKENVRDNLSQNVSSDTVDEILLGLQLADLNWNNSNNVPNESTGSASDRTMTQKIHRTVKNVLVDGDALDCVERENVIRPVRTKTPLHRISQTSLSRRVVQKAESYEFFPVPHSTPDINSNINFLEISSSRGSPTKHLQEDFSRLHNSQPWIDSVMSRQKFNRHKQFPLQRQAKSLDSPVTTSLPIWNVQTILDMTSRLQSKGPKNEILCDLRVRSSGHRGVQELESPKNKRYLSRCKSQSPQATNRSQKSTLCSVQSLELSKLRGRNDDWKKNRYSRGMMKN